MCVDIQLNPPLAVIVALRRQQTAPYAPSYYVCGNIIAGRYLPDGEPFDRHIAPALRAMLAPVRTSIARYVAGIASSIATRNKHVSMQLEPLCLQGHTQPSSGTAGGIPTPGKNARLARSRGSGSSGAENAFQRSQAAASDTLQTLTAAAGVADSGG